MDDFGPNLPAPPSARPIRKRVKRLRFRQTGWKVTPAGFINVDAAMDLIGRSKFPVEWPEVAKCRSSPFQLRRGKDRRFFRYEVGPRSRNYTLVTKEVVPNDQWHRKDLRRIARTYNRVRILLIRALESGKVKGKALTPDRGLIEIDRTLWFTQFLRIFYVGLARLRSDSGFESRRILIDEKSLLAWLNRDDRLAATSPSNLNATDWAPLLSRIASHVQGRGYGLTREWLIEIIKKGSGQKPSKKGFDRIWNSPELAGVRRKQGRPSKEMERQFHEDQDFLVEAVREGLRGLQPPVPDGK